MQLQQIEQTEKQEMPQRKFWLSIVFVYFLKIFYGESLSSNNGI
jgi:hypothetical protein